MLLVLSSSWRLEENLKVLTCLLGTDTATKTDEFSEKFQGGEGHFQSKFIYCIYLTYKQGFLGMKMKMKKKQFAILIFRK